MQLEVVVQASSGAVEGALTDSRGIFWSLLIRDTQEDFKLLRYLAPGSRLSFNRLQAPDLFQDLLLLRTRANDPREHDFVNRFERLILKVEAEHHVYLRIVLKLVLGRSANEGNAGAWLEDVN